MVLGGLSGGQRTTAELLLAAGAGADRDWASGWDGLTPLDAAVRAAGDAVKGAEEVGAWLRRLGARSAAAQD